MRVPIEIRTIEELRNFKLFDHIKEVFNKASKNGELIYKDASNFEILKDKETKMEYEVKIVEALSKRPNNRALEPGCGKAEITDDILSTVQKKNPFLHPEPELTIIDSLMDKYRLILNKYPNTKYHFLLVTKEFEKQDSLLKPTEMQIMHTILDNLNNKNENEGIKYFSFFNSGPESGYSQFHKHIQFMLLPTKLNIYQESVVKNVDYFIPKEMISQNRPLFYKKATFKHYILKLKGEDEIEDEEDERDSLGLLYMYLIKRCMNIFKEYEMDDLKLSYNFLMMPDWMMIVPRRSAKYEDIWQNSLGFMGLVCVKNTELKNKVLNIGFSKILQECGFPMEEDEDKIVYNEYGY
jgi:ATP adenylyltransferase